MSTIDYHAQAETFLSNHGITFRATLSDSKAPPWQSDNGEQGHHYRVTLSRPKPMTRLYEDIAECPHPIYRLTFDFWGSIADATAGKTEIHAYDVLACLSGDINAPESFEDYCSEMGENPDSIRAKQTWTRVSRFAKRLRAFFVTDDERNELAEIQ